MKQFFKNSRFARLFMGAAIITASSVVFFSAKSETNGSSSMNLANLTKIASANAECSPMLCGGAGAGCTIVVDGTNFTSSVCKSN